MTLADIPAGDSVFVDANTFFVRVDQPRRSIVR